MTNNQENQNPKNIRSFPTDSVGRILTDKVPTALRDSTVGQIEDLLLKGVRGFDNINYIYILDNKNSLVGVVSIKEVFRLPKSAKISSVMISNPVSVRPSTDQERAAMLAVKHNIKNVPVVDKNGLFLGAVTSDVIFDVLHQEGIEDVLRSEGILKNYSVSGFLATKTSDHFKKRLPWLLVGLLGGMFAAFVVGFFEQTLSQIILLAAFIPAVVYMADAVGSQTQTLFVRTLSLPDKVKIKSYLKKESTISFLLAVFLGLIAFILVFWWWRDFRISLIIGFSFVLTIFIAALSGIFFPWLFFRLKLDPAIASGPLSTVVRDIFSILVYFLVAYTVTGIF